MDERRLIPATAIGDGVRMSSDGFARVQRSSLVGLTNGACQCGHELGPAGSPYKELALEARRPLQSLGPYFDPAGVGEGRFEVRGYYCPGCVVPLDVEVARPGDPLLVDVELELAGAAK
jgi:acetone carboxylase gamma subunit